MKVSYKFLNELKKFLTQEDWKSGLESRLEEITKELNITPEDNLKNKIENYKLKNEKHKSWNAEYIFNEKAKNKIIELHKIKLEKLSQEKIQIESCLENGSYVLGIAPFDDINNTKLLLANIHLLYLKLSGKPFNEKAVMAIKNMFKDNFHELYDLKVSNVAGNNVGHLQEPKIMLFMNKIIENEELKLEDIFEAFGPTENQVEQEVVHEELQPRIVLNQDFILDQPINLNQPIILNEGINLNQDFILNQPIILNPGFTINFNQGFTVNPPIILNNELTLNEEITPNEEVILDNNELIINQEENFQERLNKFKEMAPKLLSLYKALDPKMLEYSYNIMQFINQFYMNGHDVDCCMLATQLAFCFGKTEDIDNFLEEEVNFESFQTIENTIALIGPEFFEASEVSLPEIKIWREINGKYGKEAIKLFAKAGDLKSAGFDIYKFAQTNAIEDVYKKVQEVSKTLKYKDGELICQQFSGQKITQFFVNFRIPLEINNHY